jgi:hypothetical protein
MLISGKQQDANRQNAQRSTGPITPEGKAAVRLNALKYGLRARSLLITGENPDDYQRLWADLESEWQPQTRTERLYLEQMSTSQWLLARLAQGENSVYGHDMPVEKQFAMLRDISVQRTRLERSFSTAMRDLRQLQKERQARPQPQPAEAPKTAPEPAHQPARYNPGPRHLPPQPGAQSAFCAPATPDTR